MSKSQEAPYGTWKSPLAADTFAAGAVSLDEVVVNVGSEGLECSFAVVLTTSHSSEMAQSTSLR